MQCLSPVSQLTVYSIHSICGRKNYSASSLVRYAICSEITLFLFSEIDLLFKVKRFRSLHLQKNISPLVSIYILFQVFCTYERVLLYHYSLVIQEMWVLLEVHRVWFLVVFSPQDELKLAVKQGATLLTCIREPVTRSANSKLSPDELENVATVERSVELNYLVQLANLFLGDANVI